MREAPEMVELILPATTRYLQVARLTVAGVASRAGLTLEQIDDIKLAVGEACTNAVEHAYSQESSPGPIHIRCGVQGDEFVVEVGDEGRGFNAARLEVEAEGPPPPESGLGFFLIRSCVDRLDIDSAPDAGTKVTMTRRLSP